MSKIQIFENPQFGEVRTAGTPEEPLFCLADVCKALGLKSNHVMERLDKGVVSTDTLPTNGGVQTFNFVNEDGLYDVILDSRKPEARAFRKWITSEVLPSIRKHGAYATADTIESIIADPQTGIRLLEALKDEREMRKREREQRLAAEQMVTKLEDEAVENKPKVVYAEAVSGSKSSCLIGELAKMISQNGVEMGEKRLFSWMRENHYLCSYGERFNLPYQKYIEQGLFTLKQNVFSVDGEMRTRNTTKVTGKGQVYFVNKFIMK